jgi:2-iminobutanoate/2-iminopropanoate deaminase
MKQISTSKAPAAIGPYSQAIENGGIVFCSGQIGLDPESGTLATGGVEMETRRALENLRAVLAEAGLEFGDIAKTTIFLADLADFEVVNRIYGEYLSKPYPARSTVQAAALPRKARVEIEAIAIRRSSL